MCTLTDGSHYLPASMFHTANAELDPLALAPHTVFGESQPGLPSTRLPSHVHAFRQFDIQYPQKASSHEKEFVLQISAAVTSLGSLYGKWEHNEQDEAASKGPVTHRSTKGGGKAA